jgi:hypothetical protein
MRVAKSHGLAGLKLRNPAWSKWFRLGKVTAERL